MEDKFNTGETVVIDGKTPEPDDPPAEKPPAPSKAKKKIEEGLVDD